jgi:hypothetical protein
MSTTQTKYEQLTPMARARLAQSNEREFRALKRDHAERLAALEAKLPQCKTGAEYKAIVANIRTLLFIPTGPQSAA